MAATQLRAYLNPPRSDNMTRQKVETIRIAHEQQAVIAEKLRRNGLEFPKYDFHELIGKGSYGRVFKAHDLKNDRVAAVKVIDVDSQDYKVKTIAKDDSIEVTIHEIRVLQQLQDAKAKNINPFFEAFQIHSQLWIVSDYCPGGSVHTLMRATSNKIEEKYIVPIARELAIGLKAIHDAGIIHRDIKAANVMIHEKGMLQIIDFGVAGVLQTSVDKRSTVIGTPHWMAPELHKNAPPEGLNYGTEVDVWAYGCTLYEIATGLPPFPYTAPGRMLGISLTRDPPRLKKTDHSEGLTNLVAFVLEAVPANRPLMENVLQNSYVADTEESHPTTSLVDLVKNYYRWEQLGGQRQSLFVHGGASAAEFPDDLNDAEQEWNFSTTANFDQQFAIQPQLSTLTTTATNFAPKLGSAGKYVRAATQAAEDTFNSYLLEPDLHTPLASPSFGSITVESERDDIITPTSNITSQNDSRTEDRVQRGGKALQGIFNEALDPYHYDVTSGSEKTAGANQDARPSVGRAKSDLPLREETESSSLSRKELHVVDINKAKGSIPNIDLANVNTIKANRMNRGTSSTGQSDEDDGYQLRESKRATMGWTFANASEVRSPKRDTKAWKFPASVDTDDSDTDTAPIFREPKRDTRAFVFPQMQPAEDVEPVLPKRPALVHATTAPVEDSLRSESGIIDIDAMMRTDAAPEERDIMRAAFSDDEPNPTLSGASSDTEADIFNHGRSIASKDTVGPNPVLSASSTDDEDDYHLELLAFKDRSDEQLKTLIDRKLIAQGVLDPLARAVQRRQLLKNKKMALQSTRDDLQKRGLSDLPDEEPTATGFGDYGSREQPYWDNYSSTTNQAAAFPDFSPDESGSSQATVRGSVQQPRDPFQQYYDMGFPRPIPPSDASMAQDASEEVLVGEATRLLKDLMKAWEFIGDRCGELKEHFEAEAAAAAANTAAAAEAASMGYDGAADEDAGGRDEGNEAGAESD